MQHFLRRSIISSSLSQLSLVLSGTTICILETEFRECERPEKSFPKAKTIKKKVLVLFVPLVIGSKKYF